MTPYPEYKETDLAWLPKIPKHWELAKIRELFVERVQKVSDKKFAPLSVSKGGIVPQIATVAKTDNGDNRKRVKQGDFVINSRSDRKGSSGISNYDGSVSLINIVLKPREQRNERFLHFLLKSIPFVEEYYRNGRGIVADLWTTRYSEMKSISLPLPPADEQEKIVRYLDAMTAKINKLIRAKKKQIALLQEQKQAIINQAVTKGLNPAAEMKDSGIDWLGKIPKHWNIRRLKNIFSFVNRGTTPDYIEDSSYTKVINQATFSRGYFNELEIRYTRVSPDVARGLIEKNDIMLASTGGGVLGKVFFFDYDGTYIADSHVTIVRSLQKTVQPRFYFRLLSIMYDFINAQLAKGSTNQTELQRDLLRSLPMPTMPLDEQNAIVEYLDKQCAGIDMMIARCEKEIALATEYKNSLISSAVTGQIDLRNTEVEPVSPDDQLAEDDSDLAAAEESEPASTEESEA